MKQKDIALIIVISAISAVVSLLVSNFLFSSPKNRNEKYEVVQPISSTFTEPDTKYFNDQSIDSTQIIRIGDNSNTKPFN